MMIDSGGDAAGPRLRGAASDAFSIGGDYDPPMEISDHDSLS